MLTGMDQGLMKNFRILGHLGHNRGNLHKVGSSTYNMDNLHGVSRTLSLFMSGNELTTFKIEALSNSANYRPTFHSAEMLLYRSVPGWMSVVLPAKNRRARCLVNSHLVDLFRLR
jgi:hypothetical protein